MTDLTPRKRAGAMTLTEAAQYLPMGIKRPGWEGYIRCNARGAIIFVRPDGLQSTWYIYRQDLDATDWEVANDAATSE